MDVSDPITKYFNSILRSAWTAIQSIEQRRRYKSEFDQNYVEYRKLHLYQDDISKRFQDLEKQLMYEKQRGNEPMCTVSVGCDVYGVS